MLSATNRKKQRAQGFDAIAKVLYHLMFDQLAHKAKPSIAGITNTAYKELKSSFTESLKGVARDNDHMISVTPSTLDRPRRAARMSYDGAPSPVPYQNIGVANPAPPRVDERLVPLSSAYRGVTRLRMKDILRLRVNDEILIVLPPTRPNKTDLPNLQRLSLLYSFQNVLLLGRPSMSELDRHDFLEAALKQRSIVRDGRDHYEFNMTITSYPERHKLEGHGLPKSEINSILHRKEGIGFYGEVRGYGSRGRVHVKLLTLPFIEVYVQRTNDAHPFQ
jgi:hypothetical protein